MKQSEEPDDSECEPQIEILEVERAFPARFEKSRTLVAKVGVGQVQHADAVRLMEQIKLIIKASVIIMMMKNANSNVAHQQAVLKQAETEHDALTRMKQKFC